MSDDGEDDTHFRVDESDDFIKGCIKINDYDYMFTHNAMSGLYKPTQRYLRRQEATAFISSPPSWILQTSPTGLPSNIVGSYIFLVEFTAFDCTKEVTHDWLRPWNSVALDGKKRVTPKWEKINLGDGKSFLRISKSRHPRFPWIKRQVIFVSNVDGHPTSPVFYQYVLEAKGDISSEEYILHNLSSKRASSSQVELPFTDSSASTSSVSDLLNMLRPNAPSPVVQSSSVGFNSCPQQDPPLPDSPLTMLKDCLHEAKTCLISLKRKYIYASGLLEMRRISEQCEKLVAFDEETQEKVAQLVEERREKLRELADLEIVKSESVVAKEENVKRPRLELSQEVKVEVDS